MFTFQFTLSNEDYYQYSKHHTYNSATGKRMIRSGRYTFPLIFFAVGLIYGILLYKTLYSVLFAAFALLWLIFFDMIIDFRLKRTIKKYDKEGKLYNKRQSSFTFNEDTFTDTTSTYTQINAYAELERVDVGEHAVLSVCRGLESARHPEPGFFRR